MRDSIKEKVFRFIRSKTHTNDLEAIVTSGASEIGSYIVVYANIVKAAEMLSRRHTLFLVVLTLLQNSCSCSLTIESPMSLVS